MKKKKCSSPIESPNFGLPVGDVVFLNWNKTSLSLWPGYLALAVKTIDDAMPGRLFFRRDTTAQTGMAELGGFCYTWKLNNTNLIVLS